jgi:ketosteroid isomerase-like protein
MTDRSLLAFAAAALLFSAAPVLAHESSAGSPTAATVESSARAPAAVVDAFHAALKAGKIPTALELLSEDAVVFESGGVERGKAEYASHHAAADAAFAQAVPSRTTRRAGRTSGDVAWILTEGRTTGTYKDKPVDRVTTETMLLRRVGGVWRIVHVHWSSAAARPGA